MYFVHALPTADMSGISQGKSASRPALAGRMQIHVFQYVSFSTGFS